MTLPRNIYFYDTEFKEDGRTIDLISLGIVSGDGRTFYAVNNEFDTRRVAADNWLMKNVMSSIAHEQFVVADFEGKPLVRDIYVTDPAAMTKKEMGHALLDFFFGPGALGGKKNSIELWHWYGAYDHVALCQVWGAMMDMPEGIPWYSNDIKTLHQKAGFIQLPKQPPGLHNALEDAKHNVVRYNYLLDYLKAERDEETRQAVLNALHNQ